MQPKLAVQLYTEAQSSQADNVAAAVTVAVYTKTILQSMQEGRGLPCSGGLAVDHMMTKPSFSMLHPMIAFEVQTLACSDSTVSSDDIRIAPGITGWASCNIKRRL